LLAVANTVAPPQNNASGEISLFGIVLTGPPLGWHLETPHALSTGAPGTRGLPLRTSRSRPASCAPRSHGTADFWSNWVSSRNSLRWLGIALTWLAVWLGGPFWFEALMSLAKVRAAGQKPKRTDQPPR
jgi:hypothetical protein